MENNSPVAENVAANVRRLRNDRGWSLAQLSEAVAASGYSMSLKTLSKLETGDRGVSVDDLRALSVALATAPEALMLPPATARNAELTEAVTAWRDANDRAVRLAMQAHAIEGGAVYRVRTLVAGDPELADVVRSILVELIGDNVGGLDDVAKRLTADEGMPTPGEWRVD